MWEGEIVEAGIDWITCTRPDYDDKNVLYKFGMEWIERYEQEGYEPREAKWRGYVGLSNSRLFVGSRGDGACLRHSHGCTREFTLGAIANSRHVSRLDLQIVTQLRDAAASVADQLYRSTEYPQRRKGNQSRVTLIASRDAGSTLYIGSRSSLLFFRVYDKHAQSPERYPKGCWRWEVELKNEQASKAARVLALSGFATADISRLTLALWQRLGNFPISVTSADAVPWTFSPPDPTNEGRLRWLESSVRPALRHVVEAYPADVVMAALGL